jgi:hypothetical protein
MDKREIPSPLRRLGCLGDHVKVEEARFSIRRPKDLSVLYPEPPLLSRVAGYYRYNYKVYNNFRWNLSDPRCDEAAAAKNPVASRPRKDPTSSSSVALNLAQGRT